MKHVIAMAVCSLLAVSGGSQAAEIALTEKAPSRSEFHGFDPFVKALMAEWKVPGLAIAVIKDGNVLLMKGYGYRDVQRRLPVTPRTLMPIGSNTKSFTATLLGMLVDEKRLEWDRPVREYLADFRLADEVAERLTTARDLLSHRTGLPRHDALYYGRSYTRPELYGRLRFLEFNRTFRQRWQYNNLMVMTAGVLAERVTGQSWEDLVRQRIFLPLGMARSNFSVAGIVRADDYALPYDEHTGSSVIPFRDIGAVGPAGSINSSVEEMIRYVQMQIEGGSYGGKQILSREMAAEIQSPQVTLSRGGPITRISDQDVGPDGLGLSAYGLGLSVTTYRGHKLLLHGGGIDGFLSSVCWMPDAKIGVVVLTNRDGYHPVPTILERNVFDRLLGAEPVDWAGRARAWWAKIQAQFVPAVAAPAASAPAPKTSPRRPLAEYAGAYSHPGYGVVTITVENGRLVARLDHLADPIPLEHDRYDVFRPRLDPGGTLSRWESRPLTFSQDKSGKIDRVAIPLEGSVPDVVFARKAI
jgi:CubicO group peptidase (beta-lactamase class C family)